ncbi:hypothetical protein GCM10022197_41130 [Microlunatus spumicola]|uniref:Phosphotransferase enzyme family protein n=1 Tax=Microlunatus spumicola TaxID=81499 RepID=A0ABP6YDQ4_9ACTN
MTDVGVTDPVRLDDAALASLLGADRVVERRTEEVAYDLETITTQARWWVSGRVERDGVTEDFRVVAKVLRSADRSPVWAFVPPEGHADLLEMLDWRVEPRVYASDLAAHLPPDLAMPRCLGVTPLDEGSAVVWLEAVTGVLATWTDDDLARSARALGRLAGSSAVAAVADRVGHPYGPVMARRYWQGRLSMQFGTAYRDAALWHHPVLAAEVDDAARRRLLGLLDAAPGLVAEIEALPLLSAHGDACPNNLLLTPASVVAIDWAFFARLPLGFDLTQLVVSEIELGRTPAATLARRQAVALPAYADGLAAEGLTVDADALLRAHRVLAALTAGVAAVPLERLDEDPRTLAPVVRERLVLLDGLLTPLGL